MSNEVQPGAEQEQKWGFDPHEAGQQQAEIYSLYIRLPSQKEKTECPECTLWEPNKHTDKLQIVAKSCAEKYIN